MLELESPIPKHVQVTEHVRRLIARKNLGPGARLPSERALAKELKVSLMTANKAVTALMREGLVVRHEGRGTFVADPRCDSRAAASVWGLVMHQVVGDELAHSDLYSGVLYRAILSEIQKSGGSILPLLDSQTHYLAVATRSDVAGLIITAPQEHRKHELLALAHSGMRFVVLSASWGGLSLPCVDGDNIGGARAAVKHLADLGHRRLAMLSLKDAMPNSRDRRLGFEAEVYDQGLGPAPVITVEGFGAEQWREVCDLLAGRERPSAIFAAGYELALHVLQLARELRLRIPQDLSLVGFDDIPSCAQLTPPLTTIRQPWVEMARRAVKRLVNMRFQGTQDYTTELLPMRLVVRKSCCSPQTGSSQEPGKEVMPL